MTTLRIRPQRVNADCRALAVTDYAVSTAKIFAEITNLVSLNEPTGQLSEDISVGELQSFFEPPGVDRKRDLRLWQDASNRLIGFGQLVTEYHQGIESYLYFDVHPTLGNEALVTEIIEWSEQRMREVGQQLELPVKLHAYSRDNNIERWLLLEKQGFMRERCFLTMACPLNQPWFQPKLPTGFTLRQLSIERDIQAWVELFNESFIDHWNHEDLTVAMARQWLSHSNYRPELNLIVAGPDGKFAAFCLGYINQQENERSGYQEAWIKLLGTRRGFRKQGLAKGVLLAMMRQLKTARVEQVNLGVDNQSLTSATRLYRSVGFQPVSSWLWYAKTISPQL